MKIGKKFKTYRSLTPLERKTFFISLPMIPLTALMVRLFGYKRTRKWLKADETVNGIDEAQHKTRQVDTGFWLALKYSLWWGSCLSRSILVQALLHRQGVPSILHIGVSTSHGEFKAHAWIESGESVLRFDRGLSDRFEPLDSRTIPIKRTAKGGN